MSRTLKLVLAGLVLAALAGAVAWWLHHYELVEETIEVPRSGEARRNPLFALQLALRGDGVAVQSRRRLELDRHRLGARDTVLLYGDPRALGPRDTARLLEWVARGGHLIVRTSAPDVFGGGDPHLLWTRLRLQPRADARCVGWQVAREQHHVEFCGGRRFTLDGVNPRLSWGDFRDGFVFARLAHGRGSVDVLADLDFLTTDKLSETPHVVLARQVLAPNYRAGTVHLVFDAAVESFWHALLRRHWPVWLPLLLALLAWLWMRAERFGPLLPSPFAERRSLLEHIAASGALVYRYGYGGRLYEAVRDAFFERLRRRDPETAALVGKPQLNRLSERLGVPRETLREALSMPAPDDDTGFRTRIATLVRLRNQL
ncbi:MAG TPA: DUF4350 domain-containing protein [Lysobacter sp.]|nr:DUF4350 domain-containing protein [Lysobacter sp.]